MANKRRGTKSKGGKNDKDKEESSMPLSKKEEKFGKPAMTPDMEMGQVINKKGSAMLFSKDGKRDLHNARIGDELKCNQCDFTGLYTDNVNEILYDHLAGHKSK